MDTRPQTHPTLGPVGISDTGAAERPRVVTLGETMILLAPQDGLPLKGSQFCGIHVAGAESNVALYLADAGIPVSWISSLGQDPFGDRILRYLSEHNVDTTMARQTPDFPTGVFFKDQLDTGTTVHYYRTGSAASAMDRDILSSLRQTCEQSRSPEMVHLSGITAALSPSCLDLSRAILDLAAREGIRVSFDVNYRPGLWPVREAAPVLASLANEADVVLVGLDEAQTLWGCETPEDVRQKLPYVREIVIKDGAHGATWMGLNDKVFVAAPIVDVVEVVGAGDAFAAGFLYARLNGEDISAQLLAGHHFAERAMSSTADFRSLKDFRNKTPTERFA